MNKIKYGFYHTDKDCTIEDLQASVGSGWSKLIKDLVDDLFVLGWNGEVLQVKEKFGGLRFYINYGSDKVFDRIDVAENESLKICEECGNPGKQRNTGWIKTLCDNHAKEFGKFYDL